jgi:serine/threonine-protein kinase RsbW
VNVSWTLVLRREAESVALARHMLLTTVTTAGVDPDIGYDLGLALTEACANVIEHADNACGYRVTAGVSDDRCWVDVVDDGSGFPPGGLAEHLAGAALVRSTAEGGRGLMLIEALSDRVSIRNHPVHGALIHFERDLHPVSG